MCSFVFRLGLIGLVLCTAPDLAAWAVPLTVWNPSFESPAFSDGGYDFLISPAEQGTYGWEINDGAFIYNPQVGDYPGAGGNGAPSGASGAQIGGIYQFGDYRLLQRLAGPDGMPGSGDDPLLEAGTIYTLTVSVGQRAVGNPGGTTWGGYDVQLIAGIGSGSVIIGRETDAATPPPGTFITRTLVFECPTIAHPEMIGQPLSILLRKTTVSSTADTDFDDVHIDATKVSPLLNANFNETGPVGADDLALWSAGFGALCLQATHGNGNANGDDYVDGSDFLAWQRQLGSASDVVGATVPEPTSFGLTVAAAVWFVARRRQQADKKSTSGKARR